MGRTVIKVGAVMEASRQINAAKSSVSSAKSSFAQTKNVVDDKIQDRSNIRGRMNSVYSQLSNIESRIARIGSTVESCAMQYRSTDEQIESRREQINVALALKTIIETAGKWAGYFKEKADAVRDWFDRE